MNISAHVIKVNFRLVHRWLAEIIIWGIHRIKFFVEVVFPGNLLLLLIIFILFVLLYFLLLSQIQIFKFTFHLVFLNHIIWLASLLLHFLLFKFIHNLIIIVQYLRYLKGLTTSYLFFLLVTLWKIVIFKHLTDTHSWLTHTYLRRVTLAHS